ncbi:MAG: PAS domain-containing sensor histidine kinase [Paracoccus denitrificans]|nr:MAG: PAS domain-containing sensor histidine kinase [Paracoccus denitrificans]PZO83377.1 MAG: PAS domain-containing sensor histidine kinase [Paracoccus denitrificans]
MGQGEVIDPNAPRPDWATLPLPAALFDDRGHFVALNDSAQIWLNLSTRSVAGLSPDDPKLSGKLRVDARLAQTLASVGDDTTSVTGLRWDIGDRTGGFQTRLADVHLSKVQNGVQAIIIPHGNHGTAQRRAARSAIGLSDMLAHEIKNPLAGIRGAAQLLSGSLSAEDQELADLIVDESRRIVALLEQVERFGDTTAPTLSAINLHDVLDRARRSIQLTGIAARIVNEYDPSLPMAKADPDLIMQAVLNLLRNAAEALARDTNRDPDAGPGTIRIRTHYDGSVRAPEDGAPLALQIEIEDDGPGIPDNIADQVFEPFISGRENGTGLGLALVSKIVADHGALIRLDSRPGRTCFRLSLPRA